MMGSSKSIFDGGIRHAERNGVERSRARSGKVLLTRHRFRPVPGSGHSFLFPVVPFPSVAEVLFPKFIA